MEKKFENFKTLSVAVRPFCPSARPPGNVKPCLSVRPSAQDAKFQLVRPSVRSEPSESHMSVRPSVQSHQNFICPSVRPFKVIEISHVRPSVRPTPTDGRTDRVLVRCHLYSKVKKNTVFYCDLLNSILIMFCPEEPSIRT